MPTTTYDLDDDVLLLAFFALNRYLGDILRASWVDKRWRRLILSTGALWNEIYRGWVVRVPIPLDVALRRSQTASLELVGDYKHFGPTAMSVSARLRTIRVYMHPVEDFIRWIEVVRGGVPQLEQMRLIFTSPSTRQEEPSSQKVDWTVFSETKLPSLREFTHHRAEVPFDLFSLPKLRTTNVIINDFSRDMGLLFERFPLIRDVRIMFEHSEPGSVTSDQVQTILARMAQLEYLELKADYLYGDASHLSMCIVSLPIPSVTLLHWRVDEEEGQTQDWIIATRQAMGSAAPWRVIISREDLDRVGHIMPYSVAVSEPVTVTLEASAVPGRRRKVRARAQREIFAGIRAALCASETQAAVIHGRIAYLHFCSAIDGGTSSRIAIEDLTIILSRHDKDNLADILSVPGRVYLPQLQRVLIQSRPFELLNIATIELGQLLAERIVTASARRLHVRVSGVKLYGHRWHIPSHVDMDEEIQPWTFVQHTPVGTQFETAETVQDELGLREIFS